MAAFLGTMYGQTVSVLRANAIKRVDIKQLCCDNVHHLSPDSTHKNGSTAVAVPRFTCSNQLPGASVWSQSHTRSTRECHHWMLRGEAERLRESRAVYGRSATGHPSSHGV